MPRVGFEPTIPTSKRAKTVHDFFFKFWFVRLLALRPLLAYISWLRPLGYRDQLGWHGQEKCSWHYRDSNFDPSSVQPIASRLKYQAVLRKIIELRGKDIIKWWRKFHNEGVRNLYSSQNISRSMRLVRNVVRVEEMKNTYKVDSYINNTYFLICGATAR
jgi:hypothetical protein